MPDNLDSSSTDSGRGRRRARRVSEVPREVVMGMDAIERKVSFVAGGIALVLAAVLLPHLLHNTNVVETAKLTSLHHCPTSYHLVNGACQRTRITHPSDWLAQFLEIIVFGAVLVYFALRSKRAGVAVCALFLGLALGTVGLPFLFLGGWLIIRALRLQKYGDATFTGSSRRAREKAQAKRGDRSGSARTAARTTAKGASKSAAAKPSGPAPSKRYTPKQKPRKR